MSDELPTIGAAMMVADLEQHRSWLIEGQRDLEIQDFFDPVVLDGDWKGRVEQARRLLDGYEGRLGIHGPTEGLPLNCIDPRIRTVTADRLKQALDCAADLGATQMVLHSPFRFFGNPHVAHTGRGLSREVELAHLTLRDVLPLSQQCGCEIVIENCYDRNSAPMLALVRSFDSPLVRASVDTGHAFGMQQVGGPPPDQWVRDAGPLLGHVHLQDTDGHGDLHWAPGEGNVNWFAAFEALGELDHAPRLLLEIDRVEKVRAGAERLAAMGLAR